MELLNRKAVLIIILILVSMAALYFNYTRHENSVSDRALHCETRKNEIDKYACFADHAAKGVILLHESQSLPLSPEEKVAVIAIETMNLVNTMASSARYAYMTSVLKDKFVLFTMKEQGLCLTQGIGICGNHQFLFTEILKKLNIKTRMVDFYFKRKNKTVNHAAAEVQLAKNKWAYFDVTWGSYWITDEDHPYDLLPLGEIRDGRGLRVSGTNSWYLALNHLARRDLLPDPFSYLHTYPLDILINKGGVLSYRFKNGEIDFSNYPKYIGRIENQEPIKIKFVNLNQPSQVIFRFENIHEKCKPNLHIGNQTIPLRQKEILVKVKNNNVIAIDGNQKNCYAFLESIKMKTA